MAKHNYPGILIVFEGIDGAGKGTQIEMLQSALSARPLLTAKGRPIVLTKEPGGTDLGWEIRNILFDKIGTKNINIHARQLLCLAAHVQHAGEVIRPALAAGKIVICDRYLYSDLAYQEETTCPMLTELKWLFMGPTPDLLFHLHGDPWTLLQRATARRRRAADVDQEAKIWANADRLREIQNKYFRLFLPLAQMDPSPYHGIDIEVRTANDIFASTVWPAAIGAIQRHFNS